MKTSAAALTLRDAQGWQSEQSAKSASDADSLPYGLPAPLPPGEQLVWQGAPRFRDFAEQIFHTRLIAAYVLIVAGWSAYSVYQEGRGAEEAVLAALLALAGGALVLCIFGLMAWLGTRATVYTITTDRIVMRIGIALSKTIDIPFKAVDSIQIRLGSNGSGNISIKLTDDARIPYLMLWPHARPWHVRHPQPMLRAVPDAQAVAKTLVKCIGAAASDEVRKSESAEALTSGEGGQAEEDAPAPARNHARFPLMAAASLVLLSLVVVSVVRLNTAGSGEVSAPTAQSIYELNINKLDSGRLAIVDPRVGETIAIVEPGRDGLVQNALRGLARARNLEGMSANAPYHLVVWDSGRVTLTDPETKRNIPMSSFGPTNVGALADLLRLTDQAAAPQAVVGR